MLSPLPAHSSSSSYAYRPYDSEEYSSFRSGVPQKKVAVGVLGRDDAPTSSVYWSCYDAGPKSVKSPIVFLPPVCGDADCFYKQILPLSAKGYRTISVHIFGSSLGGYLAQSFAQFTLPTKRVASLILCNSFTNTAIFKRHESSMIFWAVPSVFLKRMILTGLTKATFEVDIAKSVDFMVDSLDHMTQSQLASRMTLNCARSRVNPENLQSIPVTLVDVFDRCALSRRARQQIRDSYPNARKGHLKTGGNFPFLSRSPEVNLFIQIHLRQFEGSSVSAKEDTVDETAQVA